MLLGDIIVPISSQSIIKLDFYSKIAILEKFS